MLDVETQNDVRKSSTLSRPEDIKTKVYSIAVFVYWGGVDPLSCWCSSGCLAIEV